MTKHEAPKNEDFARIKKMLREARPEQIWNLMKDIQNANSNSDEGKPA